MSLTSTPTRKRGRPRNDEAATPSIDALLEASADIFARDGYDGVSLRKLQSELKVSYTFFHHYFDSKEALWKAVVDKLAGMTTANVLEALNHIDEEHSELDALKSAIAVYIRSAFQYPAIYHIYQQESQCSGPRLDYIYQCYFESPWQYIRELVSKVNRNGTLKPIPIETLFFFVQSATAPVVQYPFYQKLTGSPALNPAQIENHIQQSIDLLFNGWHL